MLTHMQVASLAAEHGNALQAALQQASLPAEISQEAGGLQVAINSLEQTLAGSASAASRRLSAAQSELAFKQSELRSLQSNVQAVRHLSRPHENTLHVLRCKVNTANIRYAWQSL
jgi:hypothetical protein